MAAMEASPTAKMPRRGLHVREHEECIEVYRPDTSTGRRILFISKYGSSEQFRSWQISGILGHHFWGCLELAAAGYHILMPHRKAPTGAIKHRLLGDWSVGRLARQMRSDEIIYCNHNIMTWTPLMRMLGRVKAKLVGLLYAKEMLLLPAQYAGVIGLTSVAAARARKLAPDAKVELIGWGFDMPEQMEVREYEPRWGLSCGITHRDWACVAAAYQNVDHKLRITARGAKLPPMPEQVEVLREAVRPQALWDEFYRHAAYSLIILQPDENQRTAVGFTNVIETMMMARPLIKTRTGALDNDLDIEKEGIGLYVNPGDAAGLKAAAERLWNNPAEAREMGQRGRRVAEERYNSSLFGRRVVEFMSGL